MFDHPRLQVAGKGIKGWGNDRLLFDLRDSDQPLDNGGVARLCTEGRVSTDAVTVQLARE